MNYYNDIDPFCCGWLKELIAAGLLPPGDVDGRSIADVQPNDLDGYTQVHFFCGIGGWPYALTLAAWPATRPVWTGSCPCQPLSVAGLGKGSEDERHLWPEFARLIGQCRPATVLGEQVASKLGREWLAGIRLDLEQMGYAVGAADLCAAGLGAPHIRQRLFWLAQSEPNRCQGRKRTGVPVIAEGQPEPAGGSVVNGSDRLADAPNDNRRGGIGGAQARAGQDGIGRRGSASGGSDGRLADTERNGRRPIKQERGPERRTADGRDNPWAASVLIHCADGKWRRVPGRMVQSDGTGSQSGSEATEGAGHRDPIESAGGRVGKWEIEPALFPLAYGIPNRVGILRGAGNSVCAPLTAKFIEAVMEENQ